MFIYDWGVLKWAVRNLNKITSNNYENIKSHIAYVKIRIAVDNMCYVCVCMCVCGWAGGIFILGKYHNIPRNCDFTILSKRLLVIQKNYF